MRNPMIAAAFAASLLAGPAFAQEAPPPPHPQGGMLIMADANKDGVVTRAELLADVDIRFGRADIDHDGRITSDEHRAAGPRGERMGGRRGGRGMGRRHHAEGQQGPRGPEARRHAPGDTDGNGILTLEEARAQALKIFTFVDRNGDGRLDTAEREAMREAMIAMRGPGGPGPRGRHGPPPPPADAPDAPQGQ